MFTWTDPTMPTEAQMTFAKKIRDALGKPFPKDRTKMAMAAYISSNYREFRALRRSGPGPDDLDYDQFDTSTYSMWDEMEAYGLDPYTGGFAE